MLLMSGIGERKYLLWHCKANLMIRETFEKFIVKSIDYDSISTEDRFSVFPILINLLEKLE